jgi:hypothetical protein
MTLFEDANYITFDGLMRYDFGETNKMVVPYVLIGGSLISALRPTLTLDVGMEILFGSVLK